MFDVKSHLISLKGKDYLKVMWRLVWFREEKPLWCIDTKMEQLTDTHAVFSAKIYDESGVLKSAGYGSESIKDFHDFIEKAETKAVGRALAMLGYGSQFAPELDEGDRIVDSPVRKKILCSDCGSELATVRCGGREYDPLMIAENTKKKFGSILCWDCSVKRKEGGK